MIGPYIDRLNRLAIVLASGSPRRRELLEQIGLKFTVIPSTFEENLDKDAFTEPQEYARKNSELKVKQVSEITNADLIIGCDTIVTKGGLIFEKPRSREVAKNMLSALSGSSSEVHSGVSLMVRGAGGNLELVSSFTETTFVEFSTLSDDVIDAYIATGEYLDKAGGYGIQGIAAAFVFGLRGDFFNVVGFPINHFCREIDELVKNGRLQLPDKL
ncbi:N-acetylserotonin O-methyltransferase protein-like [Tropilaelaps mercedesae]|uniref:N-acetylserotonin O-methyltransferase protein-like n=1 Tax=Tropilaelaps mercedesae TaxID=418985 RepID=A0A1V9Y1U9_9ACAR|nr:N-acetylserotonin O-methyltransferase protein-like [Tropilaelaps mercedesae]